MWTRFMDMHSGGDCKEDPYEYIFIEAPIKEAKVIFYNKFGHNPERVSCMCCGDDYSLSEGESLEQISAYDRGCKWDEKEKQYVEKPQTEYSYPEYQTLEQYKKRKDVLIITKDQIKDSDMEDMTDHPEKREIDEEEVYKFLRSIKGCNTEWVDSDYADCVYLPDLSKAIADHFKRPAVDRRKLLKVIEDMEGDDRGANEILADAIIKHLEGGENE